MGVSQELRLMARCGGEAAWLKMVQYGCAKSVAFIAQPRETWDSISKTSGPRKDSFGWSMVAVGLGRAHVRMEVLLKFETGRSW